MEICPLNLDCVLLFLHNSKVAYLLITVYSYVIYTTKIKVQGPVFVGVLITWLDRC